MLFHFHSIICPNFLSLLFFFWWNFLSLLSPFIFGGFHAPPPCFFFPLFLSLSLLTFPLHRNFRFETQPTSPLSFLFLCLCSFGFNKVLSGSATTTNHSDSKEEAFSCFVIHLTSFRKTKNGGRKHLLEQVEEKLLFLFFFFANIINSSKVPDFPFFPFHLPFSTVYNI